MSKVMVVEDDAALREIYSIRITAEGYDVVSASDGEEALAVAVREKPDLILSDIMMPKISGFDMLDILKNTPETANIKVIMMTALSADDQRSRGERLGCDRYLVKSQVGIEDVVNAIHDVLGDRSGATSETLAPEPQASEFPAATPETPTPEVSAVEPPVATPEPQTLADVPAAPLEAASATPTTETFEASNVTNPAQ
ncbi:MAG: response regulator [Candidatus Saccharibacteria bacterium]|nr:response regulator [Candidatus Saccharibacteria bacterium]